jgi:hypothetical protein
LTITLGSAKYLAAPLTSPRRRASAHSLMVLTALAVARMPVGPGVGGGWSGFSSGVAGEVTVRRAACVAVCTIEVPDPHPPATNPMVMTATNQVQ